jgi:peptide/nickel transport system permease protein
MRGVDAMLAFPALLLALLIITALGASTVHALVAIGVANIPGIARIVRSSILALPEAEFVLAARARGEGHLYIMFGEIAPNALGPIVVEATIRVGFAMLTGASLSFLGLGVQPPQADWGLMIRDARQYAFLSAWPLAAPGLALGVTIVGFNLFGDGLRDWLSGEA